MRLVVCATTHLEVLWGHQQPEARVVQVRSRWADRQGFYTRGMHVFAIFRKVCAWSGFFAVALAACLGCDPGGQTIPAPDPEVFANEVYPVLLRDCSFPACHGDARRPLFVPGPGRTRLSPDSGYLDPPTSEELNIAYTRARGMLGAQIEVDGVEMPLLLEKTTSGAGHRGRDRHGNNIYEFREQPGWVVLRDWVMENR